MSYFTYDYICVHVTENHSHMLWGCCKSIRSQEYIFLAVLSPSAENHSMCGLTLEYLYQDWASLVTDACTVDSLARCMVASSSRPTEDVEYLIRGWKVEKVG